MDKLVSIFISYPCNRREYRIINDLRLEPERQAAYCETRNNGATVSEAVNSITKTPEEAMKLYGVEDPKDLGY